MQLVIPMAGLGTRFSHAGYKKIKPLIKVLDKSMIEIVLDNLIPQKSKIDKVILIINREIDQDDQFKTLIKNYKQKIELRVLNNVSRGPADSVYMARDLILLDEPVTIANCDQYLFTDMKQFYQNLSEPDKDGIIITMQDNHPKWSYAKVNELGLVTEVAEKKPISDDATVGIYYWKHGSDFIKYAEQMIEKDIRVNGEFYTCPVFNEAIGDGKQVYTTTVNKMWGIGTPEDLNYYLLNK